jgi:S1-C subfamily serine protease
VRTVVWTVLGSLGVALGAGCGPSVKTGPHELDGDGPRASHAATVDDAPAEPDAPRLTGEVSRTALIEVLDEGPGAFLGGVEMNAHFGDHRGNKRFDGWEIVRFWPGDPRYASVDVRPGDIIATVNGKGFQRPENLFEVWTSLREADEIVVSGSRNGAPLELRFRIEGAAPAPAGP